MEKSIICGIDPGLSGAIAFYDYEKKVLESVHDMPLAEREEKADGKKGRNSIDTFTLTQLIDSHHSRIRLMIIEKVHSMPNDGGKQAFAFGYATGMITGIVASFNIPYIQIEPSVWKILLGLSSDKKKSLSLAQSRFPNLKTQFARAKDDGRAEAALLAEFGTRFIRSSPT